MNFLFSATAIIMTSSALASVSPADTTRSENIDSSVVSAYSFYENSISAFGATLIDPSTLSIGQNATLEQTLRLMPSIDIRERGGKSIQTDIGIRGGSSEQTGILLNGVDFTDIRTGHQSHSLPIDSDILKQIRLLDGGNQGLTGAINMVAGPMYDNYLRANISGGDHGYLYANVSGNATYMGKGTLRIFEAASVKRSDGYIQNTDFQNYNLYTRVQYSSGAIGTIDAQAGFQNRAFGANGFYSLKFPEQFEETSTSIASVRWNKIAGRFILESYLSYRYNTDRFELIKGSEKSVPYNYHKTNNYGAYASAGYVWSAGRTSISGEYRYGDILSTVLGDDLDNPIPVVGAADRFYTKSKGRSWGNVQLRHQKNWEKVGIKASFEGDFTPYGFTPLWNAGAEYRANDALTFELMGSKTMRLPTFNDLFYTATGYIGNPNLVPEKATMVKAEVSYNKGRLAADADVFYRHGKDIIDWVRVDPGSLWESSQITTMNTFGADITATYSPARGVVKSISAMVGYLNSDKQAEGLISKYAMDYMRNKASVIADFGFGEHWALSTNISFYDRAGNYANASGETVPYKPYTLVGANASYTVGSFKFYVDLDNILSTEYYDYGGLMMPGLWAMGGVVITLKR